MKRLFSYELIGPLALALLATVGCASDPIPPPVLSDAALGRVIIYRNGVAYFERYGDPGEETLTLRVPAERVDDFLKSLTIVDEKTGQTMPVSFPTVDPDGGEVEMTIKLPKSHNRLRISYVTESPAWKPTYRVVLEDEGPARLLAWAVVDNVSGEDWKQVQIGVGSTSALSFRYDLHSIRLVQRETLSSETMLAMAPPTGGSPYAVAGKKLRVMGNISQADFAELDRERAADDRQRVVVDKSKIEIGGEHWTDELGGYRMPAGQGGLSGSGYGKAGGASVSGGAVARGRQPQARPKPSPSYRPTKPPTSGRARRAVTTLARQLRSNNERVRIEGYAQEGDKDPRDASLARANALRDQLIADGVPAEQIDAIGTGRVSKDQAVRLVAADEDAKEGKKQDETPPKAQKPIGSAHFVSKAPMSIEQDHSAMVSILNTKTEAKRVYFYDPLSARGSKKFAFNAVRIKNPSPYTLDSGPFTVYAGSQFLGEGLSEPILPGSVAFIPYALDRSILADPEVTTREEIDRLLTIQRGIVTTETQRIRKTKLTLTNRGQKAAEVFVRHQVGPGFALRPSTTAKLKVEKLGGAHLFPVSLPAGEAVELVIEEQTPIKKTINIHTPEGIGAIEVYLKKAEIDPALQAKLRDVVKTYSKMADLKERIEVLGQQLAVYRTRVDEINVQLVTLRKVRQAAKLRRHLSEKMEEISEKLQESTLKMTELEGEMMTQRIELQDKVAELTLKPNKAAAPES
ncbi:MAG: DUF4139 domain-containing protein [Deltaproteobacteria bacterium]|jgi:uncharacterized coiled-coil protein SlyX|nr:DUF4139 domain-containing protein [Deltaproteobacteria bacterium]MBW2532937.1 DUF4139 domain-containing protein [Deltaproteobacteria bacterium]